MELRGCGWIFHAGDKCLHRHLGVKQDPLGAEQEGRPLQKVPSASGLPQLYAELVVFRGNLTLRAGFWRPKGKRSSLPTSDKQPSCPACSSQQPCKAGQAETSRAGQALLLNARQGYIWHPSFPLPRPEKLVTLEQLRAPPADAHARLQLTPAWPQEPSLLNSRPLHCWPKNNGLIENRMLGGLWVPTGNWRACL